MFKHLHHDGLLRQKWDPSLGTVRAINDIPHLEITSEDHDNKLQAMFTGKKRYPLSAEDPALISDMMEGIYVLISLDNDTESSMEICFYDTEQTIYWCYYPA